MNAAHSPAPAPSSGHSRWTFERKLALGYGGAAALVLLMIGLCSWQGARFVAFNRWVEHTHEVIDVTEEVCDLVTEAETNQRGYWILGDDQIRREAEAVVASLPARLVRLGELTADNPVQGPRIQELGRLVREKVARLRANLEVRQHADLSVILASGYVTGVGQQLRLQIRATASAILGEEQALLRQRVARRSASLRAAIYSLAGLGAILGLLLRVIYKLGDAELRARRRLSHELGVARDEALEGARKKSEFLANMSHEIRTPLNGIVGMAGLLLERPLEPGAKECAITIDTCAGALLEVINDVLDFSKIEAGRLRFDQSPFDLRETIEEALTILSSRATEKGLELNAVVANDVPAGLLGDSGRLRQVLLNLLGNAVKFTARGEVSLHVAHACCQPPGAVAHNGPVKLRFEVRDTGIGIAPEGRGRLFQAFSQLDGSHTRAFGGTGLGLAISKELVVRMGGDIGVESVPGVGSMFWFTARFEVDRALAGVFANTLAPAVAAPLLGWRVLLAGESSADRQDLQQMCADWGLFQQTAEDGHRALAMLRLAAASGRPFHVALLDAGLCGLNGCALAAEIRADADTGVAGTRLVLLADAPSANAAAPVTTIPADLMDGHLERPLRPRALLETLRRLALSVDPPKVSAAPVELVPALPVADGGPRVLLAEDNAINRKVALRQLGNLGCRATAAHNGREALALVARGETFDLILMDVQMPEMDGYETTRQLRARFWCAGVGPPVVAMTANAMEGDREKCLEAGMDDYLPKPVRQDVLEALLRRWLPLRPDLADGRPRDRQIASVGE